MLVRVLPEPNEFGCYRYSRFTFLKERPPRSIAKRVAAHSG